MYHLFKHLRNNLLAKWEVASLFKSKFKGKKVDVMAKKKKKVMKMFLGSIKMFSFQVIKETVWPCS